MNTLIISTFTCTFEDFERDVTGFISDMGKKVIADYEFVKVGEHKSHLLMNVLDMDALCAEMSSDKAKEWDKDNNCKDVVYKLEGPLQVLLRALAVGHPKVREAKSSSPKAQYFSSERLTYQSETVVMS